MQLEPDEFQKVVDVEFIRHIKQKFKIEYQMNACSKKGIVQTSKYHTYKKIRQMIKKQPTLSKDLRWEMIYNEENERNKKIKKILLQEIANNKKNRTQWLSGDLIVQLAYMYNAQLNNRPQNDDSSECDTGEYDNYTDQFIEGGKQFKQIIKDQTCGLIKMCKDHKRNKNLEFQDFKNLQEMIIGTSKAIKSINIFAEAYNKDGIYNSVSIYEVIIPLLHINCPFELNCQHCISIPTSLPIQKLQTAVFEALSKTTINDYELYVSLVEDHCILQYALPIISSFIQSNTFPLKESGDQQLIQQSSHTILISAIKFITNILRNNAVNCKEVINTPKLTEFIFKLSKFKQGEYCDPQFSTSSQIRVCSRQCLTKIQHFCGHSELLRLSYLGYIGVLASAISTAGGCGEVDYFEVLETLGFFVNFSIFNESQQQNKLSNKNTNLPLLKVLFRQSEEQLEIEGGYEELNSHLATIDNEIHERAKEAQELILKQYIGKEQKEIMKQKRK
ncbi:MAG: hypothetical protein EZS28_019433 [Streblomastix strix]|uniref:Uncharacterized protein n=1 Tax=Streblomastix strix TaxID=222440 RepID=A0A5J4VRN7_9EUKA|nr:MAG: hypothetical protein EZS28_019433 [Streblomastix strix]